MKHAPRSRKQPGQSDDERLDLAEVDDEALQPPKPAPKASINDGGGQRMPAEAVELRHDDADEADHRADRQIDAAREDDEVGADRRDDEEGVVAEDVAEHQRRQEMIVEGPAADEQAQRTR